MRKVDWLAAGVLLKEGDPALVNGHLSLKLLYRMQIFQPMGRKHEENIKPILFRILQEIHKYFLKKKSIRKVYNLTLLIKSGLDLLLTKFLKSSTH